MSRGGLEAFKAYWETLTRESVGRLREVYTDDAYFRDPFNEVRGAPALERVFAHMFETLEAPAFVITETLLEGDAAVLVWDFTFRVRRWKPHLTRTIHGCSHVRFAPDGRVSWHRDYWDAAGELYATLPLIGPLIRWLTRKMGSDPI